MAKPSIPASTASASHLGVGSEAGGKQFVLDGVPPFAIELALHVLLAVVFAVVIGLVIRGHVAKALKESLDKGIEDATKKIANALPALANDFASIFRSAIHEGASTLQEQVRYAAEVVIGEAKSARARFEMLVVEPRTQPHEVKGIVRRANDLIAEQQFDAAEKLLKEANSGDFQVLEALVSLYLNSKLDRSDEALDMLLKRKAEFEHQPQYYWQLAVIYTRKREQTEAIAAAERYVSLCREKNVGGIAVADALVSLGFTYFWFDRFQSAADSTEAALEILAGSDEKLVYICKANLAYYYAELRVNREKAFEYAQEALAHEFEKGNTLDTMGYVRMRFHEKDLEELLKARSEFIQAGENDPSLVAAYRHLAEVNSLIQKLKPQKKQGPSATGLV